MDCIKIYRRAKRRNILIRDDVDEFDFEDEHAGGCARLAFIGEFFGNPDESFLAWDHELPAMTWSSPNSIGLSRAIDESNMTPSVVQPE